MSDTAELGWLLEPDNSTDAQGNDVTRRNRSINALRHSVTGVMSLSCT